MSSAETNYLYAMKSGLTGMVKIGRSTSPEYRLSQIASHGTAIGLDLAVTLLGYIPIVSISVEGQVHQALSHARIRGEWFNAANVAVDAFVKAVIIEKRVPLAEWLFTALIRQARADGLRPDTTPGPVRGVSLREFARHIGVSETAVRKSIASGRLVSSLETIAGRTSVVDVPLARLEWSRSSRVIAGVRALSEDQPK